MKQILVAGLLAAIGAVALTNVAKADSPYCIDNPYDRRCDEYPDFTPGGQIYDDGPGAPVYDGGDDYVGIPERPRLGQYRPPRPPSDWGQDRRQRYCFAVGQSLRDYGYRRVRPVECDGSNFKYTAYRGATRYLIKVKAKTGRIMYEIRD